ncbi:MAG: glycosyltransferase family 4 protein [Minisyncoccia bacterium]
MEGKKKVCYLITKGVWGGAQKYVYNLAISLPKDKYEVSVVCGEGKILKDRLEEKGIKVFEIKSMKRDLSAIGESFSFFSIYSILKKIRPDVLHVNSPKAGGLGALAGRILHIPTIVYTVHGFSWNEDRTPIQKILITFFIWLTIILCHKTITISTKEELEAKNLFLTPDEKIVLIRNGVEKIDFYERNEARKILGEIISKNLENNFILGTISELNKNKGLEYAISALSKVTHEFVFLILGGGELKSELHQMIDRFEMKDKIFLLDFVPDASRYLKAFDVFTLTSVKEGLPYTIIESGLAEVPVLASRIGGIPDIIDDGKNGVLVTKGKPGEITRAIEFMISKPEVRNDFARLLKEKMEKEFSLESMLEKTIKVYS